MTDDSLGLEQLREIDRICNLFEAELREDRNPSLEDYLVRGNPQLQRPLFAELLPLELAYLEKRGTAMDWDRYRRLFPHLTPVIDQYAPPDHIARVDVPRRSEAATETVSLVQATDETHAETGPEAWDIPPQFGRYQVQKLLGQGAMGAVYLASDNQLRRLVALKIPKFDQQASPDLLERFYREARAAATLLHPNICPVFDVGEIDGQTFLSMAFIAGQPLSHFSKSGKRQGERAIARLVMKLALALQEAHHHGVVHRGTRLPGLLRNCRLRLCCCHV